MRKKYLLPIQLSNDDVNDRVVDLMLYETHYVLKKYMCFVVNIFLNIFEKMFDLQKTLFH